jgi:transcriptional regulator with XRE-family HTH domain
MSSSQLLIDALKREIKSSGLTYAGLAQKMNLSEASIKRLLAPNTRSQLSLSRIDAMCKALDIDFATLAEQAAQMAPLIGQLSIEQEREVVQDERLLLVAICVLSNWSCAQIVSTYQLSEPECVAALVKLDKLGVIELRSMNRYRLKIAKTFKWQAHGPVMQFFRTHVAADYFAGAFAREDEGLYLVHGSIAKTVAADFVQKLQRLGQEFSEQHQQDQKLPATERNGYTLVLAMREWEFAGFAHLRR